MDWQKEKWDSIPENIREHIAALVEPSEQGDPIAGKMLDTLYAMAADRDQQIAMLYYGSSLGEAKACYYLGCMYAMGYAPVPQDIHLACECMKQAKTSLRTKIAHAADVEMAMITSIGNPDFKIIGDALVSYKGIRERVFVPMGVTRIGSSAFEGNQLLEEVYLPWSVRWIEARAFLNCKNLKFVHMPDRVYYIGSAAFSECRSLPEIQLPSHLLCVEEDTFMGCKALKTVHIPEKVSSIGKNAFYGSGLTAIELPQGVREIGKKAFYHCPLKTAVLPESVRFIGAEAFHVKDTMDYILFQENVSLYLTVTIERGNKAFQDSPVYVTDPDSGRMGCFWKGEYIPDVKNE